MTRDEYNANPNICPQCGKPILCGETEFVSNVKRRKFCSRSCSTTYHNLNKPKEPFYCQDCGELIGYGYTQYHRRKYCDKCNPNHVEWTQKTYGEVKQLRAYQCNSRIRDLARKYYLAKYPTKCAICGYNKHVEIHHIQGISTFSDDTPISIINNDSNLIALCPNHHWEIENGLLIL